jgi:hypothetical protein
LFFRGAAAGVAIRMTTNGSIDDAGDPADPWKGQGEKAPVTAERLLAMAANTEDEVKSIRD